MGTSIINPWVFYWADVLGTFKGFFVDLVGGQ